MVGCVITGFTRGRDFRFFGTTDWTDFKTGSGLGVVEVVVATVGAGALGVDSKKMNPIASAINSTAIAPARDVFPNRCANQRRFGVFVCAAILVQRNGGTSISRS